MSDSTVQTGNTPSTGDAQPAAGSIPATTTALTDQGTTGAQPEATTQQAASEQKPAVPTDGEAKGNAEAKAGETAQADKPVGAPEKYEFKAPEGHTLDDGVVSAFSEVAKDLNLPQEAAQKVVDKLAPVFAQRQMETLQAIRTGWGEAARTDKEFGGDKLGENLAVAKKALDTFGTPELRTLLEKTGLGDNPEIIRAFYRAGKQISEDSFVPGGAAPSKSAQRDAARALYPNQSA